MSADAREWWAAAALLLVGTTVLAAREARNPYTSPEDVAAGGRIYRSHCTGCHGLDGTGGRSGPSLTKIGTTRSLRDLKNSILRPDDDVPPNRWTVRAVTKDGRTVTGLRLNEDTFSVQLLDSKEQLVSLAKSELDSYEVNRKSLMPSYEGKFSEEEIGNLVAYLSTLR